MNHNVTLAIVAIVAVTTLTAMTFAIPQQALAYRHHNQNNNIKVDQQVNQQNSCTGVPVRLPTSSTLGISTLSMTPSDSSSVSGTVCLNSGDNSADVHR